MEVLPDTKLTEACFTPFRLFNTVFTLAAHPAHPIPVTLKLFFVIFFCKGSPTPRNAFYDFRHFFYEVFGGVSQESL